MIVIPMMFIFLKYGTINARVFTEAIRPSTHVLSQTLEFTDIC